MRLQDIVEITGLPKTTVLRLLKTLISMNYVRFDPERKKYFVGPESMSLGFTVLSGMTLRDVAVPYMEELSALTDQNVGLGVLDGDHVVYIERIARQRILNIDVHAGTRLNPYRSSIGRAILAFLPKEQFQKIFRGIMKDKDAKDFLGRKGEKLGEILQDVRRKGYALNDGELIPGLSGIAAPVFNSARKVEGAVNIPVLSQVVGREDLEKRYAPLLLEAAEKISAARGYGKNF